MLKQLFAYKRILILGLGLHGGGVAITKWLVKQRAVLTVSDIKTRKELAVSLKQVKGLPIRFVLGSHPIKLLNNCDMIVQNPGVPSDHPILKAARKKQIPIENEASLFLKLCPTNKLAAITGTRGKSTTVSLLGDMMKYAWPKTVVAGNIRDTLLFDVLDKLNKKSAAALELSSWQLEVVGKYKLRIPLAVITNVLPDHLNRYSSFASYIKAKTMIFSGQNAKDVLVLNWDNSVTRKLAIKARAKVYWFSVRQPVARGCFVSGQAVYWRDQKKTKLLYNRYDLKLIGDHNLANTLAASTAAVLMGVPFKYICRAVKNFKGLHDRLEFVRLVGGTSYYNDTTATSPDATISALSSFKKQPIVLIAGGTDKKLSYQKMAQIIRRRVKALVLLPGTATVKLQRELKNYHRQLLASSMPEAVKLARQLTPPGGVVLLSPGAASFGLFKHEFDRGEACKRAVKNL